MKKRLFRILLCAGVLAVLFSLSAFAAAEDETFDVLINGEPAAFTDAQPQMRDDRSFLPFVAVFDQLGFPEEGVRWDGETETVTAVRDGMTISLTIGEKKLTLTENGVTRTVEMDVAPYVDEDTWRTYVPCGLVAAALGYRVGWDAQSWTVLIDDVDAILAANTETYTLIDRYLEYNNSFSQKNYKVTGAYQMDMGMSAVQAGVRQDMEYALEGRYEMLTADTTALQFDTDMTMDATVKQDGVDITDQALGGESGLFPLTVDFEMCGDLEQGVLYFQSAALCQMMGQPDLGSAWFKLDMAGLMNQMEDVLGMSYADLLTLSTQMQEMRFEEYLEAILQTMQLTSAEYTTSDLLAEINALVGDSAFRRSGTSYVNELNMDGISMTFTLYTNGSAVNGYALDMTAQDVAFGEMKMNVAMRDNTMEMSMGMEMTAEDSSAVTMTMTMDGTYQQTGAAPAVEPPAGAVVVDLASLMPQG